MFDTHTNSELTRSNSLRNLSPHKLTTDAIRRQFYWQVARTGTYAEEINHTSTGSQRILCIARPGHLYYYLVCRSIFTLSLGEPYPMAFTSKIPIFLNSVSLRPKPPKHE